MDYVREFYGVPAKRGMRVRESSEGRRCIREGRIASASHYVFVILDGDTRSSTYHPTDLIYLGPDGEVLWPVKGQGGGFARDLSGGGKG
jgi:hypothetical protein